MAHSQKPSRWAVFGALCFAWLAASCAAQRTLEQPPDYPRSEVLCRYVGLEAVTQPKQQNEDSVTMLAVYRFSEPNLPPPKERLALKFQVNRSRVDELRNHLEAQPEVICTPDTHAHHHPRVQPFLPGATATQQAPAPLSAAEPAGPSH